MFKPFIAFADDEALAAEAPAEASGSGDYIADTLAEAAAADAAQATPVEPEPVADPYADFGGRQQVEDAVALSRALSTEAGVRAMAVETLKALGLSPAQIEATLSGEQAPSGAPQEPAPDPVFGDLADEDVVTVADVKRLLEQVKQEVKQPWEQAAEAQRQQAAGTAVDSTLAELGVSDPDTAQLVLLEASRILPRDEWDPTRIAEAVRQGHAQLVVKLEKARENYVKGKVEKADALPTHIGDTSGSSGGSPLPEPKDLQEAFARVRAEMRQAG
jgi:DNA-binding transcriptional MerR regulator